MPTPQQRNRGLTTRTAGDDVLVHNAATDEVHCLTGDLARVWQALPGGLTEPELACAAETDPARLPLLLAELQAAGLLDEPTGGLDRRSLLKRAGLVGAGAVAFPIVTSAIAPALAAASTKTTYDFLALFKTATTEAALAPFDVLDAPTTATAGAGGFTESSVLTNRQFTDNSINFTQPTAGTPGSVTAGEVLPTSTTRLPGISFANTSAVSYTITITATLTAGSTVYYGPSATPTAAANSSTAIPAAGTYTKTFTVLANAIGYLFVKLGANGDTAVFSVVTAT